MPPAIQEYGTKKPLHVFDYALEPKKIGPFTMGKRICLIVAVAILLIAGVVLAERPLTDREVRRAANKLERFKNFHSGIIAFAPASHDR